MHTSQCWARLAVVYEVHCSVLGSGSWHQSLQHCGYHVGRIIPIMGSRVFWPGFPDVACSQPLCGL
ncbi:uncharacterized protein BO87DRAFT_141483 [Aspergillus neoniger CBS 115656]|uniref:Uncharacterized protein n=1 Tax=Aspergillus neoniger (strain CBS 115656) TaxID=1448310 RepID=A0A318YSD0_ASPNB|nr:hypothetical protein BO87DRAFT_141483 [Aspergillus neoniger CBS 115656]PYH30898.1 hypothetical protein BO87DRAFT_141483 [Aspergillus neoniger CBS 115656]